MKFDKTLLLNSGKVIITWLLLNALFNLLGLWITKLISETTYAYLQSVGNEFIKPILIQTILFGIIYILSESYTKTAKWSVYMFGASQFILFNLIFFTHLSFKGGMHFVSSESNWGLVYLSLNGQYLIDTLYSIFPVKWLFEGNRLIVTNTFIFYIQWILLPVVYYICLSVLSKLCSAFIFESYNNNKKAE